MFVRSHILALFILSVLASSGCRDSSEEPASELSSRSVEPILIEEVSVAAHEQIEDTLTVHLVDGRVRYFWVGEAGISISELLAQLSAEGPAGGRILFRSAPDREYNLSIWSGQYPENKTRLRNGGVVHFPSAHEKAHSETLIGIKYQCEWCYGKAAIHARFPHFPLPAFDEKVDSATWYRGYGEVHWWAEMTCTADEIEQLALDMQDAYKKEESGPHAKTPLAARFTDQTIETGDHKNLPRGSRKLFFRSDGGKARNEHGWTVSWNANTGETSLSYRRD